MAELLTFPFLALGALYIVRFNSCTITIIITA